MAFGLKFFTRKRPVMQESGVSVGMTAQQLGGRAYPELENSAFWGCLTKLVRTYSTLPWKVYRDGNPPSEVKGDFWVKYLFNHPAPYLNGTEWRAIMAFNYELFGEAFAIIERNKGVISALLPVAPNLMQAKWENGRLFWKYCNAEGLIPDEDVLHFMAYPTGYTSVLNPSKYARRDLDVTNQSKNLQSSFYKNGATVGGIFTVPKGTPKEVKEQIKQMIQGSYSGSGNAARTMVIEDTMKYEPIHLEGADIQKLEQASSWTAAEVYARFFGSSKEATYSNANDVMQAEMRQILPRINIWEAALNEILPYDVFTKFDLKNYFRADSSTLMNICVLGVNNSLYTPNEARRFLDLPPIEGGDMMRVPLNYGVMGPDGKIINPNAPVNPFDLPAEDKAKSEKPVITDKKASDRAYLMETQQITKTNRQKLESIMRKQSKDYIAKVKELRQDNVPVAQIPADFSDYVKEGTDSYGEQYASVFKLVINRLYPIVQKQCKTDNEVSQDRLDAYAARFGQSLAGRYAGQCTKALRKCETDEDYSDIYDAWMEKPSAESTEESNRAGNAFQVFMYGALGVTVMHVVASGDACSFCQGLDGKVVSVNGTILAKGQDADDGDGGVITISKNYKHPPFHTNCMCGIAPGE